MGASACGLLRQADAVVVTYGCRVVGTERVENADCVGFVGQAGDVICGGPAEGGDLLVGGEVSPGDLAAEDQRDNCPFVTRVLP